MRFLLLVCLAVFWPVFVSAQERNYTVTFTASQVGQIVTLLKGQRYDDVAALIYMIQTQVNQQEQAAQGAAVESLRKQLEQEAKEKAAKEHPDGSPPPSK